MSLSRGALHPSVPPAVLQASPPRPVHWSERGGGPEALCPDRGVPPDHSPELGHPNVLAHTGTHLHTLQQQVSTTRWRELTEWSYCIGKTFGPVGQMRSNRKRVWDSVIVKCSQIRSWLVHSKNVEWVSSSSSLLVDLTQTQRSREFCTMKPEGRSFCNVLPPWWGIVATVWGEPWCSIQHITPSALIALLLKSSSNLVHQPAPPLSICGNNWAWWLDSSGYFFSG